MNYQKKDFIIHAVLILFLAAALVLGYLWVSKKANSGDTETVTVTLEVVHGNGESREIEVSTGEEYLGPALTEAGVIQGEHRQYGLYIVTADGETADEKQQQWWCITKKGEAILTGADATAIADGDHFELTLTTGW